MVSLERLTYPYPKALRARNADGPSTGVGLENGEVMVMFGSSVKLDADLLKRCRQHAQDAGYSSVEEFIAHVLERELKSKQEESEKDQEEIARRLQGLGYIE